MRLVLLLALMIAAPATRAQTVVDRSGRTNSIKVRSKR